MEGKVKELSAAGNNITRMKSLPSTMIKAAFVVINDENKGDLINKGVDGRSRDGFHMMKLFRKYGFESFYLHNPTKVEFLKNFDYFLEKTFGYLVFYYTGNGVKASNGKNALLFGKKKVRDRELLQHILSKKQEDTVLLHISDSCHNGSVLDFNKNFKTVPPNVISIAAVNEELEKSIVQEGNEEEGEEEDENEYQCKHIEKGGQGVFAYHFRKAMTKNPRTSPNDLYEMIIDDLKRHNMVLSISSSSLELLDQNIFY